MGWQRGALLLATGAASIIVSTNFGGDPKDAALAVATGNAILNIGSGFFQNGLQDSYDSVVGALSGRSRSVDGLPINHDLARAIRRSHLDAITYLLEGFEADFTNRWASRSHRPDHSRFLSSARTWVKAEQKITESKDFLSGGMQDKAIGEVREVIENARAAAPDTALTLIADAARREAAEEFTLAMRELGHDVPIEFEPYFSGTDDLLPWSLAAQAFFAQRLKDDERVRTVVFLDRFNALGRGQADIVNALVGLRSAAGDIADRLTTIEARLDEILARSPGQSITDPAALASDLATAIAAGSLPEQIVRQLLIAHSSLHSVAQTAWQVRQLVDELTDRFFGRADVFAALDDFADSRDPGILILTAPAGSGKSACLANWMEQRRRRDPHLVHHFITGNKPLTTSIAEITGHLAAQLTLGSGVSSETGDVRGQNLFTMLKVARQPVTLVLDGLDEAASLLQPFVEAGALPPHVRIILSARAQEGEWPTYLSVWRRLEQPGLAIQRLNLPKLTPSDSLLWLEDYVGHLPQLEMEQLAAQLHRASDGLPLFLSFIMEDFVRALPTVRTVEERRRLISDVPAPFTDYLNAEMARPARLTEGEAEWTTSHRQLFALLSVLRGPITFREVAAIDAARYPDLRGLQHRFARWLTVSNVDDEPTIAFAHPHLAQAFGRVLRQEASQEEWCLLEWSKGAWSARGTRARPLSGAAYPLDWLPEHLLAWGHQSEAVEILTNPDFLLTRLNDPTFGAARLAYHIGCWFSIPIDCWPDDGRQWNAAWVENESRLIRIANGSEFARLHLGHVVRNCLADCNVLRMGRPRTKTAHPPLKRSLLRSHDAAHWNGVSGILPVDEHLVSWGEDGAIRFWNRGGTRLPGGDDEAHRGKVAGVLPVGEHLVSWGQDGAIRFWSRDGMRQPGGDDGAHQDGIGGVLAVGDHLVSWGKDTAIRFWNLDGAKRPGGVDRAHRGTMGGVLPVGEHLVSWSQDGAIRFWSEDGTRLPGGDDQAHRGWVLGVLPVGDHLVSWGYDGAIRFWSRDGIPQSGGDDQAHPGSVGGVLPMGDHLVSWGYDGAIRFWSWDGILQSGGDDQAHRGSVRGVLPVGEHLISWGRDGAIRFWNRGGTRLPGGDDEAHRGSVRGVLPVGEHLVSWGHDGAIRFWSCNGTELPGGNDEAHRGEVGGVLPVGEHLVSWGQDGAIRFWSRDGTKLSGGDNPVHRGRVCGVLPVGEQLVSWGQDGTMRFWSEDGTRLPGGDDEAHRGEVGDVLPVGEHLVSWGLYDGRLRFWSRDGMRQPGGDDGAHQDGIGGVLAVGDHLVSWGKDGAIRFWSRDGTKLPGGDNQAHPGWVRGVLPVGDHLVSWGYDGTMRFWSEGGTRLPGGDDEAHRGGMGGVLTVGEHLVSWGQDGAIRFWSRDGIRQPGGDDGAHQDGIGGVLAVGDHLVSWGKDATIRFWSLDGTNLPGGVDRAHRGTMGGVLPVGEHLVSWGYDGAIRFWSEDGTRLPGGDDQAHRGWVRGVLPVGDYLVSWGYDGSFRWWSRDGHLIEIVVVPGGFDALCPAKQGSVTVIGRSLWMYGPAARG